MPNKFVHVELSTTDIDQAKDFYAQLFDWGLEDVDIGADVYTMIHAGEDTGGGMLRQPIEGAPSAWLPYVQVDDIHAATLKAQSLGATVLKGISEIRGAGWLSIIADPTGAHIGLWQTSVGRP